MASAYLKRGRWYLRYKDPRGRWRAEASTARTKTEAKRLASEMEGAGERERKGLEVGPGPAADWTLAELLRWWLKEYSAGMPSHATNVSAVELHLVAAAIGVQRVPAVTSGDLEQLLHDKGRSLAPETVNHLRGYVSRAYNTARRAGLYKGPNPAAEVRKRRVPRRTPDYLRAEEVMPVFVALPSRWLSLFATAVYTGLRKGELAALRKGDVDLDARLLTVQSSWNRDCTKGGHADVIPLAVEVVPYLRVAIDASHSEFVFPGLDGRMMSRGTQLEIILRRALKRAGIVTGYTHKCRRSGCGHAESSSDAALRRCPTDGRKLWAVAETRKIRFHDLRHTTASLLMMAGANPAAVQRILRHSDPKITTEVYGHLAPGYLRSEVDRLSFGVAPPEDTTQEARLVASAGPFVTRLLPGDENGGSTQLLGSENHQEFPALGMERDKGFEPSTFSLGRARARVQAFASIHNSSEVLTFRIAAKSRNPLR
jgi:integrase